MTYPDETIMAASERLMELIEIRDAEEALREREERWKEMAEEEKREQLQGGEPDDA